MIPNLLRSAAVRVFFSRMWLKMTLACCGSALPRALLSDLRSSSKDAEAPPSRNPASIRRKVLLVLVWRLLCLCWNYLPWVFWATDPWSRLNKEWLTSSLLHDLEEWLSLSSEMIKVWSWVWKQHLPRRNVLAVLKIILLFRVIVLLVEHFFNLNIITNQTFLLVSLKALSQRRNLQTNYCLDHFSRRGFKA